MAERSRWILRLAETATTDEVIRVAGDFIRSRPGDLWPSLPRNWRPRPMLTTDDVSQYAIALVSAPAGASAASEAHAYELAGFFCAASQRLAFILSAAVAGQPPRATRGLACAPRATPDAAAADTPPVFQEARATA